MHNFSAELGGANGSASHGVGVWRRKKLGGYKLGCVWCVFLFFRLGRRSGVSCVKTAGVRDFSARCVSLIEIGNLLRLEMPIARWS